MHYVLCLINILLRNFRTGITLGIMNDRSANLKECLDNEIQLTLIFGVTHSEGMDVFVYDKSWSSLWSSPDI